ncbi:MAG: hypothetical protein HOB97_12590 [Verrucomicrobia bacterium]|nr:hypothetical protein [Verrucomicrobiota bacterium]
MMTMLGFFAAPTVAGLAKGNNEKTNKKMETKTRVIIFNCTAPNIRRLHFNCKSPCRLTRRLLA